MVFILNSGLSISSQKTKNTLQLFTYRWEGIYKKQRYCIFSKKNNYIDGLLKKSHIF